ncbi:MAG: hypothetical protein HFH62_12885 [Lachnospiraceae bacterium]|nr:hypothetical protein [Lachnospiraceae bacterium]
MKISQKDLIIETKGHIVAIKVTLLFGNYNSEFSLKGKFVFIATEERRTAVQEGLKTVIFNASGQIMPGGKPLEHVKSYRVEKYTNSNEPAELTISMSVMEEIELGPISNSNSVGR